MIKIFMSMTKKWIDIVNEEWYKSRTLCTFLNEPDLKPTMSDVFSDRPAPVADR